MIERNAYTYLVPIARAIASFLLAGFLGIIGGWIGLTFNAFAGYPWSLTTHTNIYVIGIGLGAGAGGYLAWMELVVGRRWIVLSAVAVLLAGVAGVYGGYAYGRVAEATYFGRAYTIDNNLHLGAALGAFAVATLLGVITEIRTKGR
ncbi:MAG: hypothetical protein FJ316_03995 [SAR202 cluster bacterium]|nr:hypothetical protein [SAR202 cluster bacterium]